MSQVLAGQVWQHRESRRRGRIEVLEVDANRGKAQIRRINDEGKAALPSCKAALKMWVKLQRFGKGGAYVFKPIAETKAGAFMIVEPNVTGGR